MNILISFESDQADQTNTTNIIVIVIGSVLLFSLAFDFHEVPLLAFSNYVIKTIVNGKTGIIIIIIIRDFTSAIFMMSMTDIETLMLTGMFTLLILSKLNGAIFLL